MIIFQELKQSFSRFFRQIKFLLKVLGNGHRVVVVRHFDADHLVFSYFNIDVEKFGGRRVELSLLAFELLSGLDRDRHYGNGFDGSDVCGCVASFTR